MSTKNVVCQAENRCGRPAGCGGKMGEGVCGHEPRVKLVAEGKEEKKGV